MAVYLPEDISNSYGWLGHQAYTELVALHPEYKPGRENYEHNLKHNAFPRPWYTQSLEGVMRFVERYHGTHLVCYSENERPSIFKNEKGYARSAKEEEVEVAKSMFFDFDFENKNPSKAQLDAAREFLTGPSNDYFSDLGLQKPELAFSGRGYHLQLAYPAIKVTDCPDLAKRQRKLAEDFGDDFHKEMSNLEMVLDSTQFLRAMVKVYGTSKPGMETVSRFCGDVRKEDPELRNHLLGMSLEDKVSTSSPMEPSYGPKLINVENELPVLFRHLLQRDEKLMALWNGRGKANGDASRSGYDFSLVRRCLAIGYSDINNLASILTARPDGAVTQSGKGEDYIRRTIANVLLK